MQAAVLAYGIAEGQYFSDGNKRTAALACEWFLLLNGHVLTASDEEMEQWLLAIGTKTLTTEDFADHLRAALDPPLQGTITSRAA